MKWLCVAALALSACTLALADPKDEDAPPDAGVDKTHVTITIRSRGAKAVVYWGRKKLGTTPVTLERKRDSGPLDLVLRAGGYLPVATRAYTHVDDIVTVQMTPKSKAHTIYGYKRIPDAAPVEVAADGGVPQPASAPVTPP